MGCEHMLEEGIDGTCFECEMAEGGDDDSWSECIVCGTEGQYHQDGCCSQACHAEAHS